MFNNVALFAGKDDIFCILKIRTMLLQKQEIKPYNNIIKYFVQIICCCRSKPEGLQGIFLDIDRSCMYCMPFILLDIGRRPNTYGKMIQNLQ